MERSVDRRIQFLMQRLLCFVIVAFAGVVPVGASDLSSKQISEARELYDIKCAKCHKFYNPSDYSQAEWDMWMKKMSRKAKLKGTQSELLAKYLQGFRDKSVTTEPPK
jgi:hypothetical protein